MNVLHVTNAYPASNYPSYGIFIKEQIDSLGRLGINCDVAYIDAINGGKRRYFEILPSVREKIRGCDLVHCHHTYTGFLVNLLPRGNRPLITSFMSPRGCEGKTGRYKMVKSALFDHVLNKSDFFIQKDSTHWETSYPGKGFYIPNGIDLEFFREYSREYARKKLNLESGKRILFVSALNLLREQKQYNRYRKVMKILRHNYGHNVAELLLVNEERWKIPLYFNAADVHLLCSLHEGSPNSVKEALACNIPVVSTNVGNVSELMGGVDGCYVSSGGDPWELAALVHRAMKNDRVMGRDRINTLNLHMDGVALKIQRVYETALGACRLKPQLV